MDAHEILQETVRRGASDLHMTVGIPPMLRLHGRLTPLTDEPLTPGDTGEFLTGLLTPGQLSRLDTTGQLDLAVTLPTGERFRLNAYRQRTHYAAALRCIKELTQNLSDLGLPPVVNRLCELNRGLVLVTGPTGSGKSTTLAAIIDRINQTKDKHILTLEDPIEYLHTHKKSIVNQREMGVDSGGYAEALRAAMRQDPDIILVGEMRDLETISTALTAAETGHLVMSTLHTTGAAKTIDRVIDVFPPHQQQQIRVQLSMILEAVVSQQLIPLDEHAGQSGRACATEVLVATPAVRNLIREGKTPQINNVIATSAQIGMHSMDFSLRELVKQRLISADTAREYAADPEQLMATLKV